MSGTLDAGAYVNWAVANPIMRMSSTTPRMTIVAESNEIASQLIFGIFELESVWIELEEAHLLVFGASRGDENRARERVSQMKKTRNSHTKGESNQT